jgi:ribonuclease Z
VKIVVLGYGGWISSPWLGHTSLYVVTDKAILLDAGEGAYARMAQCGLPLPDAVVLSHHHGDHVLGLPTILLFARRAGKRVAVVGLAKALEAARRLLEAVAMPHLAEYMEPVELGPRGEAKLGETLIRLAPAKHSVEAAHVRVEHNGKCVAYSGDTAPTEELVELAKGCDVLAHEVSGNPGQEEPAHAVGHSTTSDAVEAARRAGARALLPIHFYLEPPRVPAGVDVILPYPCAEISL